MRRRTGKRSREAWAGDDSHTDDRIGRGTIDCDACCVSVVGGLTPGPFLSYLRTAAFSGRGDDGLLQRFQVLVWPDLNGAWQDVDRWPDTSARRTAVEAFGRLANLNATAIGAETDRFDESVPFLRFDPAAQDEFLEWRSGLEHELRSGQHHEAWDSYLAKHRSLVPSIALIDHLANGGVGPVRLPSLTRALAWLEYLKSHAARIYDGLLRRDQSAARALGTKIMAGALRVRFSLRDVYNQAWSGLSDRAAVVAAVDVLCDLAWLRAERRETQGRTATEYVINPKLMVRDGDEQA